MNPAKQKYAYDMYKASKNVKELLEKEGYEVDIVKTIKYPRNLVITKGSKTIKAYVRRLEIDLAYKNSTSPHDIYKTDVFRSDSERDELCKELDIVIAYDHLKGNFAVIPISEFESIRSVVIYEKEGVRSQYFNSLGVLEDLVR